MIAYIKGHIEELTPGRVVLDVAGIGYGVEISTLTFEALGKQGEEVKLLIYHHFTDSDQRLFGFFSANEKNLFEKLITVKGVGPKLGLTILSGLSAKQLIGAIAGEDTAALSQISGIGKKTAERIILELKDKMEEEGSGPVSGLSSPNGGIREEAVNGLEALGFKKKHAREAVSKVLQEEDANDVSAVIKKALIMLNR